MVCCSLETERDCPTLPVLTPGCVAASEKKTHLQFIWEQGQNPLPFSAAELWGHCWPFYASSW